MTKKVGHSSFDYPLFAILGQGLVILCLGTYLCTSIHFPDFYEHLTKGNWIIWHGRLPDTYLWTTIGGHLSWSDPNWLFEVIVSSLDTYFGIKGLIIAKIAFTVLAPLSFACLFSYLAAERFFGTLIAVIVSCGIFFHAPFLPSLLGWSLMALLLLQCFKLADSEESSLFRLLLIFVASLVFANTHGSYLLSSMLCLSLPRHSKKNTIILSVIFLLAAILNPYVGSQIVTALQTSYNQITLDIILQRDPASIYNFTAAFLTLLWLLFALFWHYDPKGAPVYPVVLAGGLSVLGLGSAFVLPYALFVVGILLSIVWGRGGHRNKGNLGNAIYKLKTGLARVSPIGILWVLICLTIVNVVNRMRHPESLVLLPNEEIEYFIESGVNPPLFHEAFIGGYLVYRFSDEKGELREKVMQTTYSSHLYRDAAISDFSLKSLDDTWRDNFRSYAPNTVLCRQSSSLYQLLLENPDWTLAFSGKQKRSKTPGIVKKNPFVWAVFKRRET